MAADPRRVVVPVIGTGRRLARLAPLWTWVAGVLSAVLATVLGAWVLSWATRDDGPAAGGGVGGDGLPFTIAVIGVGPPYAAGWIPDMPPGQVPPRPTDGRWDEWVERASGVPVRHLYVTFTVQGRSEAEVVLTGLRVRVTGREPALEGTIYGPQGGDPTAFRAVEADLDADPPRLSYRFSELDIPGMVPQYERRPIRFPYTVSVSDTETFDVLGYTRQCDRSWVIDLRRGGPARWSSTAAASRSG